MPNTEWRTPPQFARELGVHPDRVRRWIATGELRAVNVADAERPRWRISPESQQEFLRSRTNAVDPRPGRRLAPTQAKATDVIDFF